MPDVVVTVPMGVWSDWIAEGDLPGDQWSGATSYFNLAGVLPNIKPGERVYVVAHGRLRGYAPLVHIVADGNRFALVRQSGAVAVTISDTIKGFRGWRYVWWARSEERPFPEWKTEGVAR